MNPYRYRGYRYDTETGLYYLQSRYYSPEWGRFINADALAGQTGELLGHNMFAYCKNNAVNGRDPSGFHPVECDEYVTGGGSSDYTTSYNSGYVIPASNNTISSMWTTATGALSGVTRSVGTDIVKSGTLGGGPGIVNILPKSSPNILKPLAKAGNALGWAGVVAFAGMDIGNIWTAHNGLTSKQRLAKSIIHGIFIGATLAIGFAFIAPLFAGGALAIGGGFLLTAGTGYLASVAEGNVNRITGLE